MKKTAKVMMLAAVMVIGTAAFAGPRGGHRHHKRDGLEVAAGIVGLVTQVLNPQPVIITTPPVHRPAVIHHRQPAPKPRQIHYRQPAEPHRQAPRHRR